MSRVFGARRLYLYPAFMACASLAWQSVARAEAPPVAVPETEAEPSLPPGDIPGSVSMPPPSPSAAEPTSAVPPVPLADLLQGQAKQDYDAGRLLYDSGDFAGALLKFQNAYDAAGDPRLLWNAAACERNLRHYAKAILLVRRFLAARSPVVTPDAANAAQAFIDAAEPLTAPLEVDSNEPSAQVYLDDELLGAPRLASGVRVDLGTHRIVVEERGFQPYAQTLTVTSSAKVHVTAFLRALALPMPIAPSTPFDRKPANETHASVLPAWAWVVSGCVALTGIATAGYFIFRPSDAPGPIPGSIGTYRF